MTPIKKEGKPRKIGVRALKRKWLQDIKDGIILKCCICQEIIEEWELTADHIEPLEAGGDSFSENLGPAHLSCNAFKANLPNEVVQQLLHIFPDISFWCNLQVKGMLNPMYKHWSKINKAKAADDKITKAHEKVFVKPQEKQKS
ncbi:MAG: HNH endonuclease [Alphaproteobacteria bacterium]|nr:HNH endonuclease [Alphaproteobacteria bacterium]